MGEKVLAMERQQSRAARSAFEFCVHVGIYNVYLAYLAAVIEVEQKLAYLSRTADGGILRGV